MMQSSHATQQVISHGQRCHHLAATLNSSLYWLTAPYNYHKYPHDQTRLLQELDELPVMHKLRSFYQKMPYHSSASITNILEVPKYAGPYLD